MIIKIIIFVSQIKIFFILILWTPIQININTFNYNKNKNICTANQFIPQIIIFFIFMLWTIIEILIFITQIIVFLILIPSSIIKIIIFMAFGLPCLCTRSDLSSMGHWGWLALPWAWARPAPPRGTPGTWASCPCVVQIGAPRGAGCLCRGHEPARAATRGHLTPGLPALALGLTRAPRGVGVVLPRAHSQTRTPRGKT